MADLYDIFPEDITNVKFGDNPGHADVVAIGCVEEFTSIATAQTVETAEGDTMTIVDDHTFPVNKGFINFSGYREGVEVEGQTQGDAGFQGQEHKVKIFLVGDHKQLKARVQGLMNRGLILLFQDPKCQDTRMQQLGCKCSPATLESFKKMSGNKVKGGKKGFELVFTASEMPADYEGTITYATT